MKKRFKNRNPLLMLALLISIFFCISCGSSDDDDDNNSNEYTATESDYQDAYDAAKTVSALTNSSSTAYSSVFFTESPGNIFAIAASEGCPSASFDPAAGTLNISFAEGCEKNDILIEGAISGTFSFTEENLISINLAFDEFTVEDEEIDGAVSLTVTLSADSSINLNCNITYTDSDGQTSTLIVTGITVIVDNNGTPLDLEDDKYVLNGNGTFTNTDGETFDLTFADITANATCYVPVSGILTILKTSPDMTATVDFGDGTCDKLVDITINQKTQTVDITKPFDIDL